jgi:hypothetical protein
VSLPLIRGKADSSLAAAGSGCGCHVTGKGDENSSRNVGAACGALGLALLAAARRRPRRS